jgi:hypothetical protein
LAIAGIAMGSISLTFLPIIVAILLPAVNGAREKALENICLINVRQCTLAWQAYEQEHGTAPNSWDDLQKYLGDEKSRQQVLHCRLEQGRAISYEIMTPGKRLANIAHPAKTIIIREINAPHHGRRAVGFADLHAEMSAEE